MRCDVIRPRCWSWVLTPRDRKHAWPLILFPFFSYPPSLHFSPSYLYSTTFSALRPCFSVQAWYLQSILKSIMTRGNQRDTDRAKAQKKAASQVRSHLCIIAIPVSSPIAETFRTRNLRIPWVAANTRSPGKMLLRLCARSSAKVSSALLWYYIHILTSIFVVEQRMKRGLQKQLAGRKSDTGFYWMPPCLLRLLRPSFRSSWGGRSSPSAKMR